MPTQAESQALRAIVDMAMSMRTQAEAATKMVVLTEKMVELTEILVNNTLENEGGKLWVFNNDDPKHFEHRQMGDTYQPAPK